MTHAIARIPSTALEELRAAALDAGTLQPLEPAEYAAGHALFEERSDQRAVLTDWLATHCAARPGRDGEPVRVLSIGCGDGSVDVAVALALAAGGRTVAYVGVEPHGPSGHAFAARLGAVPGVTATLVATPFADARPPGRYDLVLAVHSLYYVADLAETLRRAYALLAPGGELVVLHAPREPLNVLVGVLAPGPPQPFAAEVADRLEEAGLAPAVLRLEARLDLDGTGDAEVDRRLLEFTVQACLPAALRPLVRAALAERALPCPGLVLPHPVDALVVRVVDEGPSGPAAFTPRPPGVRGLDRSAP